MKNFCESLGEHEKNINDFEKKKTLPFTKEELKLHQVAKVCNICGKRILKENLDVLEKIQKSTKLFLFE